MRGATSILVGAALLALAGQAAAQPAPSPFSPPVAAGDCAALAGLRIEDTNLLSATPVPAADGLPAYCRVLGYVRSAINFVPAADDGTPISILRGRPGGVKQPVACTLRLPASCPGRDETRA